VCFRCGAFPWYRHIWDDLCFMGAC
jgi:hypothetical protein